LTKVDPQHLYNGQGLDHSIGGTFGKGKQKVMVRAILKTNQITKGQQQTNTRALKI
jgi:hypothetical protein